MSRRFALRKLYHKEREHRMSRCFALRKLYHKEREHRLPRRFVLRSSITKGENIEYPDALFYGDLSQREKTKNVQTLCFTELYHKEREHRMPRRFVLRSSITKRENIECPDALFYGRSIT